MAHVSQRPINYGNQTCIRNATSWATFDPQKSTPLILHFKSTTPLTGFLSTGNYYDSNTIFRIANSQATTLTRGLVNKWFCGVCEPRACQMIKRDVRYRNNGDASVESKRTQTRVTNIVRDETIAAKLDVFKVWTFETGLVDNRRTSVRSCAENGHCGETETARIPLYKVFRDRCPGIHARGAKYPC